MAKGLLLYVVNPYGVSGMLNHDDLFEFLDYLTQFKNDILDEMCLHAGYNCNLALSSLNKLSFENFVPVCRHHKPENPLCLSKADAHSSAEIIAQFNKFCPQLIQLAECH